MPSKYVTRNSYWGESKNLELYNGIKIKLFKTDYYRYKLLYMSLMVTTKQNLYYINKRKEKEIWTYN